jgi:hypothetical protein
LKQREPFTPHCALLARWGVETGLAPPEEMACSGRALRSRPLAHGLNINQGNDHASEFEIGCHGNECRKELK